MFIVGTKKNCNVLLHTLIMVLACPMAILGLYSEEVLIFVTKKVLKKGEPPKKVLEKVLLRVPFQKSACFKGPKKC